MNPNGDEMERGQRTWSLLLHVLRSWLAGESFAAGGVDGEVWPDVCRMAQLHRVLPILHRVVEPVQGSLPAGAWEMLHDRYLVHAARGTAGVAELDRVIHELEASGVAVLPLRGPLFAEWAYGDAAARQSADLDLLVRPHQAAAAMAVLERTGYSPQQRLAARQSAAYARFQTERAFLAGGGRGVVDLHWRALPAYLEFSPHDDLIWARMQRVKLSGREWWMMSPEDTILHLAAHGMKHGWGRLGLVLDLAVALQRWGGEALAGALKCARRAGKERMLLVGIGLVDKVLAVRHADSSTVQPLVDRAAARCADPMLRDDRGGQDRALMRDSLESVMDRFRYAANLALVPTGVECGMVSLPRGLWPLYYPLRWCRLAWKHTVGRASSPKG